MGVYFWSRYGIPDWSIRKKYLSVADPGFSWGGGGANSQSGIILQFFFAKNSMKMKEFRPPERGGASLSPP